MKQYVYSVVLYYDIESEGFTVAIHDLDIYSTAENVEEAFLHAKDLVKIYFDFAQEMNEEIPQARSFIDVYFENTQTENIVLLVDVKTSDK